MWKMYDKLIAQIPNDLQVKEIVQTRHRTLISNGQNLGMAMRYSSEEETPAIESFIGKPLKEVAQLIKSWNFQLASIGLAAINSYLNQEKNRSIFKVSGETDVFKELYEMPKALKIATIGHFHCLNRYPDIPHHIHIFELNPLAGDYPATASEYLLPEMDVVFITGSTIVNKSLPRLLELSRDAETILVGPSSPMSEVLFEYGVDQIAPTLYNVALMNKVASSGPQVSLSKTGQPIILRKKDF